MKKILTTMAIAAALAVSGTSIAQAQTNTDGAKGGAAAGTIGGAAVGAVVGGPVGAVVGGIIGFAAGGTVGALTADDAKYARSYVVKHGGKSVVVTEPLAVGKPLPKAVKCSAISGYERLNGYCYAYVNNQYLLIDDKGNIAGVIE